LVISYIELDYDATKNIDAFEALIDYMADSGMTYFSINHPVDHDPVCGYVGYFPDGICPRCGRKEGEGVPVSKLLSLTSYNPTPAYAVNISELEREDIVPNTLDINIPDENNHD
jgi:ribonucleoside-triphosphate reductase (formate)